LCSSGVYTSHTALSDRKEYFMKINIRGRRAYLYRRRWVPVGPGVPHAYSTEDYVGVIHADAESIPEPLLKLLSEAEQAQLHDKVLRPAATVRTALKLRERDPLWRIVEAAKLLEEAAQLSQEHRVPRASLASTMQAIDGIRQIDNGHHLTRPSAPTSNNKLAEALTAVKAAADAIRDGAYGHAPAGGARSTRTYQLWAELSEALDGNRESLLRALQEKGFVKTRKG
jgi:hypothetical protein